MKILFIAEWDAYKNSGVLSKLKSQVKYCRQLGQDAYLILITPKGKDQPVLSENYILLIENSVACYFKGFIRTYLSKVLAVFSLKKIISEHKPDIVYYRQGIWYPGLIACLGGKSPYIVEINTDDEKEITLFGRFKAYYYLYTRKFLLENASGFVAVTSEIEKIYQKFGKPTLTIANGIDLQSITKRKTPNNKKAQLIFVGSPGYPWHGIDKVLIMAEQLPEFDFHLVGFQSINCSCQNVINHGYLDKTHLCGLYQDMDIGISTLSLHIKGMKEACPLKAREYVAYGLPLIVGYIDPDLANEPFVLNIGNYANNVLDAIPEIRSFILKMKSQCIHSSAIDFALKEQERIAFFRQIKRDE